MTTNRAPSIALAQAHMRASHQWKTNGDEWFSAGGIEEAVAMLDEVARRIDAWGDAVLRELARDPGYAGWVDEQRVALQALLGAPPGVTRPTKGGAA